jgi:hypothetical protein
LWAIEDSRGQGDQGDGDLEKYDDPRIKGTEILKIMMMPSYHVRLAAPEASS